MDEKEESKELGCLKGELISNNAPRKRYLPLLDRNPRNELEFVSLREYPDEAAGRFLPCVSINRY